MNMTVVKGIGKIALKGLTAIGILGLSGLGVKIANDLGNSAYKDCKKAITRDGVYIHYGHTKFEPSLFKEIKNEKYSVKPGSTGFWASGIRAKYGWKQWCKDERFGKCTEENSLKFTLKKDAKVLKINSASDLDKLPKINYDIDLDWICLDFEKLKLKYDAIEVNISSDYKLYHLLYGWDCDSILILNENIVVQI